jgi:hypothetical protein
MFLHEPEIIGYNLKKRRRKTAKMESLKHASRAGNGIHLGNMIELLIYNAVSITLRNQIWDYNNKIENVLDIV